MRGLKQPAIACAVAAASITLGGCAHNGAIAEHAAPQLQTAQTKPKPQNSYIVTHAAVRTPAVSADRVAQERRRQQQVEAARRQQAQQTAPVTPAAAQQTARQQAALREQERIRAQYHARYQARQRAREQAAEARRNAVAAREKAAREAQRLEYAQAWKARQQKRQQYHAAWRRKQAGQAQTRQQQLAAVQQANNQAGNTGQAGNQRQAAQANTPHPLVAQRMRRASLQQASPRRPQAAQKRVDPRQKYIARWERMQAEKRREAKKAEQRVERVIHTAKQQVGKQYVWGGESPETGFDCSGLVQHAIKKGADVKVPRTAAEQYEAAVKVPAHEASRGNLVFFKTRGNRVSHVGIYLGNNKFVHAPRTGRRITTDQLTGYWKEKFVSFGRIPGVCQTPV